jgi:hypothetical protein
VQPEPVSPELVLVDPELARRERARLEEKAYLQSVLEAATLSRPSESQLLPFVEETLPPRPRWRDATTFARRRLVPAALMCSLLANGFLVADLVARHGEEAAQVAVRMVTLTQSPPLTTTATTTRPATAVPSAPGKGAATKASPMPSTKRGVEQKVVSLILSAPARKLPRNLVDPTTGLVKNNVQVVCTKRAQRSFLCAVRPPSVRASGALYVRYRTGTNGHATFRWYRRS